MKERITVLLSDYSLQDCSQACEEIARLINSCCLPENTFEWKSISSTNCQLISEQIPSLDDLLVFLNKVLSINFEDYDMMYNILVVASFGISTNSLKRYPHYPEIILLVDVIAIIDKFLCEPVAPKYKKLALDLGFVICTRHFQFTMRAFGFESPLPDQAFRLLSIFLKLLDIFCTSTPTCYPFMPEIYFLGVQWPCVRESCSGKVHALFRFQRNGDESGSVTDVDVANNNEIGQAKDIQCVDPFRCRQPWADKLSVLQLYQLFKLLGPSTIELEPSSKKLPSSLSMKVSDYGLRSDSRPSSVMLIMRHFLSRLVVIDPGLLHRDQSLPFHFKEDTICFLCHRPVNSFFSRFAWLGFLNKSKVSSSINTHTHTHTNTNTNTNTHTNTNSGSTQKDESILDPAEDSSRNNNHSTSSSTTTVSTGISSHLVSEASMVNEATSNPNDYHSSSNNNSSSNSNSNSNSNNNSSNNKARSITRDHNPSDHHSSSGGNSNDPNDIKDSRVATMSSSSSSLSKKKGSSSKSIIAVPKGSETSHNSTTIEYPRHHCRLCGETICEDCTSSDKWMKELVCVCCNRMITMLELVKLEDKAIKKPRNNYEKSSKEASSGRSKGSKWSFFGSRAVPEEGDSLNENELCCVELLPEELRAWMGLPERHFMTD